MKEQGHPKRRFLLVFTVQYTSTAFLSKRYHKSLTHVDHIWQELHHNEMHNAFCQLWGSKVTFRVKGRAGRSASHCGANRAKCNGYS